MNSVSSSCLELPRPTDAGGNETRPEFADLYRSFFGFAWASMRRLGVPEATIDDAAQDLWIIVHRRLDTYDPDASMKAWLFGIARRVASHHRRAEQRNRRKLAALSVSDRKQSDLPIQRREAALTVETFLSKLDERKRTAFVLSELEGWTAPEIARISGTNANTIYSRIRLAKEQLRAQLSEEAANVGPDEAVETLKIATEAPEGAAKRTWMLLAPKLATVAAGSAGTVGITGAGLTLAKLKFAALGAAIGALGLAVVDQALPEARSAPPPDVVVVADADPGSDPADDSAPAAAPEVAPPVRPSPDSDPDVEAIPAALVPAPSRARVPAEPIESDVTVASDTGDLAAETALLSRAKKSLQTGSPKQALTLVAQHAKQYPSSSLNDVRVVIKVQALCASDPSGAATLADEYAKEHPGSAAAKTVRHACDKPGA